MNTENVKVDYSAYTDISDEDFVEMLELSDNERQTVLSLSEHCFEEDTLYASNLYIEDIVHNTELTPYQVILAIHSLQDRRLVVCNVIEDVGETLDAKRTFKYANARRSAYLNIEYPVIYNCMKEQGADREKIEEIQASISSNALGDTLSESGMNALLDFLNYIQGQYHQPLTETTDERKRKETEQADPTGPYATHNPSGGGLGSGDDFDRHQKEIWDKEPVDDDSMAEDGNMEESRWGPSTLEVGTQSPVNEEGEFGGHTEHSKKMGVYGEARLKQLSERARRKHQED